MLSALQKYHSTFQIMYLGILLVLVAASVKKAAPHNNAPRPPGVYWDGRRWRDDRGLDLDTGAGAVTYIHIYGSQLGIQGSSIQTETERSSDSDMWMVFGVIIVVCEADLYEPNAVCWPISPRGCPFSY